MKGSIYNLYIYVWNLFHHVMILGNITCSSHVYLCHTYNVLHWYDNVKMSQVFLIDFVAGVASLWWGLSIPHGYVYDPFSILKIALRSSGCEGDVTSFPPRINTVFGVTCFFMLDLTSPLRLCSHFGERNIQVCF